MSEQEKKSGGSVAGGSSVVMVEQSAASRHKQPYRPTDLQEDAPELHHKRSKAPAVPSVTEELKDSTATPEIKERKESENAVSSDKHKHNAAKKLSPNTKRRDSSPETIALAPMEVETKKSTSSPQPIPAQGPMASTALKVAEKEKVETEKKSDDDSITEEIAELRTPAVAKKESEWGGDQNNDDTKSQDITNDVATPSKSTNESLKHNITDSQLLKKKEITWYDGSYLPKEHDIQELGSRSRAWMLERKVSVGPCLGTRTPFNEPSGITICIPKRHLPSPTIDKSHINQPIKSKLVKPFRRGRITNTRTLDFLHKCKDEFQKSIRSMDDGKPTQSGICITVSRKCLEKPTKSGIDFVLKNCGDRVKTTMKEKNVELKVEEVPVSFLDNIKGKLDNMCGKIKSVLHI